MRAGPPRRTPICATRRKNLTSDRRRSRVPAAPRGYACNPGAARTHIRDAPCFHRVFDGGASVSYTYCGCKYSSANYVTSWQQNTALKTGRSAARQPSIALLRKSSTEIRSAHCVVHLAIRDCLSPSFGNTTSSNSSSKEDVWTLAFKLARLILEFEITASPS